MFPIPSTETAQLALDTIYQIPTQGIPSWLLNVMQHSYLERFAGVQPGDYANDPENVYLAFQRSIGTCLLDQWIPRNPLTMGDAHYPFYHPFNCFTIAGNPRGSPLFSRPQGERP